MSSQSWLPAGTAVIIHAVALFIAAVLVFKNILVMGFTKLPGLFSPMGCGREPQRPTCGLEDSWLTLKNQTVLHIHKTDLSNIY